MLVALILIEICLAVAAQLVLRKGAIAFGETDLSPLLALEAMRNPWILLGLALHGVSFFLYIFILSRLRLNIVYPIATGGTIVLIALGSVVLLREQLTLSQGLGMLIILVGIFLVYLTG